MTKAFRFAATGGPEVLSFEDTDLPAPGPGEAQVRHTVCGLNYIDVYHRTGLYPAPLPSGIGLEAAGAVEAVGEGVTEVSAGQRVAYAGGPLGAYAEARNIPAHRLVALPDSVDDTQAAAMMLQGMTAHYLLRRTHRAAPGEAVLVHAAAGGVGLILCQWAKHLGAAVIGTAGSPEKAELARANGCDHVILYKEEDTAARVREITGGEGVAVAYDSVGKDTFEASLNALRPLGVFVSFGNASGPVAPFEPGLLAQKGSLFFTRPTLMTYTAERADLLAAAEELFAVVASGAVKIHVNQILPLAEAAQAHRDLEARRTTGATVLTV